ncbi:MAG: N-acetyltransferase [Sphingobacteriales bacterium]|nr:MAG: N-acetyltransferase [Sphingobacteriales bacterium]
MILPECSADPCLLDVDFIHDFLRASYWAKDCSRQTVETCIRNSVNIGMYLSGTQIGYARVVTDQAVFAYLMDVFIAESYRGRGYGEQLVAFVLNYEPLRHVKTWRLATTDAHELYRKFGFQALAYPEKMMEWKRS